MRSVLKVDREAIIRHYFKVVKLAEEYNPQLKVSVMVKDFYRFLGIQNLFGPDVTVWGESVNYKIFDRSVSLYEASTVVSVDQVKELNRMAYLQNKQHDVYVPINMKGNRDGLSFPEAKILKERIRLNFPNISNVNAAITCGCLHGDTPTPSEVEDMVKRLKQVDFNMVSVGGSFFAGWLFDGILPRNVDDLRIGEYLIYGTIPFYDVKRKEMLGSPAVSLSLEVLHTYPERGHVLLKGGAVLYDKEDSYSLSGKIVNVSTEYTILEMETMPVVGSRVTIIPSYHSLIKLARL